MRSDRIDEASAIRDITAIKRFLADKAAMKTQLAKLENALRQAAGDRFDPIANQLKDYNVTKHFKQNRLLTNYFRDWAMKNGFAQVIKLTEFLAPSKFYSVLVSRSLFFDRALAEDRSHGELTHIIQLWCVTEHAKDNPGFISVPVPDLIESIGRHDLSGSKQSYWSQAFELNDDYSVGSHNKFLLSESCHNKFPVLGALLLSRYVKEIYYKYLR
jgi:hypothetical protein